MKLACSSCVHAAGTNSIDVIYVQHLCLIYSLFHPLSLHCTASQDDLNVQKMLFNYASSDFNMSEMLRRFGKHHNIVIVVLYTGKMSELRGAR